MTNTCRQAAIMLLTLCAVLSGCANDEDFNQADAGDTDTEPDVCERWLADRADLSEGAWDGDSASCEAGDVSAEGRSRALTIINLYRWLADLPAVTTDPANDAATQDCALMMHAAGELSHSPDAAWPCYTADGAGAAGSSNIASAPGVAAVDLYMVDPGNENTLGHRRWVLSNDLGPIGLGSTDQYSCLWVLGGSGAGGAEWIAWPPPGEVPFEVVQPGASWSSLNETGWSIQSSSIDLTDAAVTVISGDSELPVETSYLANGYGEFHAVSFIPDGWEAEAGATYTVQVTGIEEPFGYDVTFVACE